jgi:hypothetical protein
LPASLEFAIPADADAGFFRVMMEP